MTAPAILDLERAGFTREQVEALARLIETQTATKADVDEVRHELTDAKAELKAVIAAARTDLERQIAEVRSDLRVLEHRMTIKLGGIVVTAVAVLGAFLRLFPGGHPDRGRYPTLLRAGRA